MTLVAVYGTLRQGQGNHTYFLSDYTPLSQERLSGWEMTSVGDMFPACVRVDTSPESILVEVYDVHDDTLSSLDRLEGFRPGGGGMYEREVVETTVGDALIYTMPNGHSLRKKIPLGDWVQYRQELTNGIYS